MDRQRGTVPRQLAARPRELHRDVASRSTDLLLFAIAFAILHIVPPFLRQPFPLLPLARIEDAFALLRLVLIPLYWLLLRRARGAPVDGRLLVVFLSVATFFAYGLGMHDAANAIGHLVRDEASDVYALTYFFDELASHVLWHAGVMALSVVIVWTEVRHGTAGIANRWPVMAAAVIYGLTFFLMVIEGGTVAVGLPFTIAAIVGIGLAARRAALGRLSTFFLVGYAVAFVLFVAWGIYWGGFPEPSEKGFV